MLRWSMPINEAGSNVISFLVAHIQTPHPQLFTELFIELDVRHG